MGKLLDLAKALASERSLHGRLGRWILEASSALDTGSTVSPDYGQAKKGPALAVIGQGDRLVLELPGLIRGVTYQASEGNWVLVPGKTYLLRGEGSFVSFSDAVNGELNIAWVDDYGDRLVGGSIDSPTAHCTVGGESGVVSMIYTVPTTDNRLAVARLRCVTATGTAQIPSGYWSSTVLEIG